MTRALILLERGRLRFSQAPSLDILTRKLEGYRVKLGEDGHDRYEADTEAIHDDTVMALCFATWDSCVDGRVIGVDQ